MKTPPWINETFTAEHVPAAVMDQLWAEGWRHFGPEFFRYSVTFQEMRLQFIIPLRIVLADFTESKSQRRVRRANEDVQWEIRPAEISVEAAALFEKHKQRFKDNVPESLAVFLGDDPSDGPVETLEFRAAVEGRVMAISYVSLGHGSMSSTYAVFDPEEARRSPGILTMLKEIEWARERGLEFCYPGYATLGAGIYDYKKRFRGLQGYDWDTGQWRPWREFEVVEDELG